MLSADTQLARSPDVLEAVVEGETVLMSVERGNYYGLAATAHEVWQRLAEPALFGTLCAGLAADYDAPLDRIAMDVEPFVEQMIAEGLIRAEG